MCAVLRAALPQAGAPFDTVVCNNQMLWRQARNLGLCPGRQAAMPTTFEPQRRGLRTSRNTRNLLCDTHNLRSIQTMLLSTRA